MKPTSNSSANDICALPPRRIVEELDRFVIGQQNAKRAVALALRDRWRRQRLPEDVRGEIKPKNILMIGPTGVGKTEIARRISRLAGAPFIKVEATKFTEIGYVGRDIESIIRDLSDAAVKMVREQAMAAEREAAAATAEERLLDAMGAGEDADSRESLRGRLRSGQLDNNEIEIELKTTIGMEIMAPPGMEELSGQLHEMFERVAGHGKQQHRRLKVPDALRQLTDEECNRRIDRDKIKAEAVHNLEQNGIVFIDELDKLCSGSGHRGAEISREGVQRDLLPLVEGSTVNTRHGMVRTDHVLFIGSGAFHAAKPSDLMPELQGRFPIRVELSPLGPGEFRRILTEPDCSLTYQYQALLGTEGVTIEFTEDGLRRIAELASQVNEKTENIGARRLHTVMERLLEPISFSAPEHDGKDNHVRINAEYVDGHLADLADDIDLSRYVL